MNKHPHNIKAEALINYLLKRDGSKVEHRVFLQGAFRKNYKNDILRVENINRAGKLKRKQYYLNRLGFYDKLPEGVFHSMSGSDKLKKGGGKKEFSRQYEQQQREIEHARKFFMPFENSMFGFGLKIESFLGRWHLDPFQSLQATLFKDTAFDDLAPVYRKRIARFACFFASLSHNVTMLQYFLSVVLGADVGIKQSESLEVVASKSSNHDNTLGQVSLSKDFVCGDEGKDWCVQWLITITPLHNQVCDYVENPDIKKVLEVTERYFIQAGVTVRYKIHVLNYAPLCLYEKAAASNKSYLGYNIMI